MVSQEKRIDGPAAGEGAGAGAGAAREHAPRVSISMINFASTFPDDVINGWWNSIDLRSEFPGFDDARIQEAYTQIAAGDAQCLGQNNGSKAFCLDTKAMKERKMPWQRLGLMLYSLVELRNALASAHAKQPGHDQLAKDFQQIDSMLTAISGVGAALNFAGRHHYFFNNPRISKDPADQGHQQAYQHWIVKCNEILNGLKLLPSEPLEIDRLAPLEGLLKRVWAPVQAAMTDFFLEGAAALTPTREARVFAQCFQGLLDALPHALNGDLLKALIPGTGFSDQIKRTSASAFLPNADEHFGLTNYLKALQEKNIVKLAGMFSLTEVSDDEYTHGLAGIIDHVINMFAPLAEVVSKELPRESMGAVYARLEAERLATLEPAELLVTSLDPDGAAGVAEHRGAIETECEDAQSEVSTDSFISTTYSSDSEEPSPDDPAVAESAPLEMQQLHLTKRILNLREKLIRAKLFTNLKERFRAREAKRAPFKPFKRTAIATAIAEEEEEEDEIATSIPSSPTSTDSEVSVGELLMVVVDGEEDSAPVEPEKPREPVSDTKIVVPEHDRSFHSQSLQGDDSDPESSGREQDKAVAGHASKSRSGSADQKNLASAVIVTAWAPQLISMVHPAVIAPSLTLLLIGSVVSGLVLGGMLLNRFRGGSMKVQPVGGKGMDVEGRRAESPHRLHSICRCSSQ